jgi:hypothetical protein
MSSKEELRGKIDELTPQLERTLAAEHAATTAKGKPFDFSGWILGQPLSQKYPTGPAYKVGRSTRKATAAPVVFRPAAFNACL